MTSARTALTILVLMAGALLAAPAGASAQVACGDTITEDTTLVEDLDCAEGDLVTGPNGQQYALLIGADGVTLDLDGHRVGDLLGWGEGIGVFGRDDVTIRNGDTRYITLAGTTDSQLIRVARGIELLNSDRNRIAASTASGGDSGLSLWHSDDNVIEGSSVVAEGGMALVASDRNLVRRNRLCGGMDHPLFVGNGSDANLIKRNVVPDRIPEWNGQGCDTFSEDGILVQEDTAGNRLIRNTVLGVPGDGIHVDSPSTTLTGNTTNFNGDYGIEAVPGVTSGMNYARGNWNPLQCLNVTCRPSSSAAP